MPAKRQPHDQERQWRPEEQCANWPEMDCRGDCEDRLACNGILLFGDHGSFASPTLSRGPGRLKHPTTHDQNPVEQDDGYVPTPAQRWKGHAGLASISVLLPNGSGLSCGRNGGGRKVAEPLIEFAGVARQFLPTRERPAAASAC